MKAIIVGAGYGSRLSKLTKNIPKNLLDINGKNILERQITIFQNNGINEIIVIVGQNKDKYDIPNVKYVEDKNFHKHEQLTSLMVAKNEIKDDVLVSFADVLIDDHIMKEIIQSSQSIGIAIDLQWKSNYIGRTQHPTSEADLALTENNKIIKIKKDLKENSTGEIGEFLGLIKLDSNGSKEFLKIYDLAKKSHRGRFHEAASFEKGYLTDMIQELIDVGEKVVPIFVHGKWCEIDTPQDLEIARKKFA